MRFSTSTGQRRSADSGFTLIEVLISIFILTIGMLSLLGVFGLSMSATMTAQEDRIAKQLAQDAFESIYTARDTNNIPWSSIENVSGGGTGIFVTGLHPLSKPARMPLSELRMTLLLRHKSSLYPARMALSEPRTT